LFVVKHSVQIGKNRSMPSSISSSISASVIGFRDSSGLRHCSSPNG
jgi:hypothetical protein